MSMHMKWAGWAALLLAGVCAGPIAAQDAKPTSAEKIRQALRQKADFDYNAQDFQDLTDHLRNKTGLNVVLDPMVAQDMSGLGIRPGGPGQNVSPVEFKGKGANLHQALQRLLTLHTLSYVVLEDSVLITFEEEAIGLQMGQRIDVKVEDVPLCKALKDLARSSGVNIVIDPRVKKEAQTEVSLDLENTSVENAVRLLAEMSGLKSVRSDNVLFVTSEARADKMREETPPAAKNPRNGPPLAPPPFPVPPPGLVPQAPPPPAQALPPGGVSVDQ